MENTDMQINFEKIRTQIKAYAISESTMIQMILDEDEMAQKISTPFGVLFERLFSALEALNNLDKVEQSEMQRMEKENEFCNMKVLNP